MGVLKKPASGVLAPLSCSRTPMYVPRANKGYAYRTWQAILRPSLRGASGQVWTAFLNTLSLASLKS
jgi:hypothetical protein